VLGLNLAVSVRIGTQTAFDHKMIYVHGSDQPPPADQPASAVSQVSGVVRDGDGKPVGGATLTVRDSAGNDYRTTSGRDGGFSIKSSDSKPIAVGRITVEARMDGYRIARATVQGAAGGAATVRLTLAAVATPSPTPPAPSAAASLPGAAEGSATGEGSTGAAPVTLKEVSDGGGSSPLWIILGGLLVAAGLGALVLSLLRRRNAPNQPVPAPTRVNAPVGGSRAGIADAPTAVLPAVPPDRPFSDPYGTVTQDGGPYGGGSYSGPAR
jgi:hypothetical protein